MAVTTQRRPAAATPAATTGASVATGPTLTRLCGWLCAFVGFIAGAGRIGDNSLLTHIATGRLLVRGDITTLWNGWPDPYSASSAGKPWIVQSWLASVVYGALDALGEGRALRLFFGLSVASLVAVLWALTAGAKLPARLAITVGCIAVGSTVWSQRPLLLGLTFVGIVMLALDERVDVRWLVPVMWVWVNWHGSFPFAFVVIAAAALGRRLAGTTWDRELRVAKYAFAGTIAGGLLNPVGPQLLVFPVKLLGRNDVLKYVNEWNSPNFSESWARYFLVLLVLMLVGVARRASMHRVVPAAVMVAAALVALRNVALALVVIAPVLAEAYGDLGTITGERRLGAFRLVPVVLVLAAVLVVVPSAQSYDLRTYPVAATDWLEQRGLLNRDGRVFHEDQVGNYFEWRFGTKVAVHLDDRFELHDAALVTAYIDFAKARPAWADAVRDADVILWRAGTPGDVIISQSSDDWRVAYRDRSWFVACRSGSAAAARC